MKKRIGALALAIAALMAAPASAGIYADDATRCLVKSTSEAEQVVLVRWIFVGMALHPAIKEFARINDSQREELDKQFNAIVTKLLVQVCRKEVVAALKYEGPGFMEGSFSALGEVAMGGLMANADVSAGLTSWAKYLDEKDIMALGDEAGRPFKK